MTMREPKGKGARTQTAKMLVAMACDIERAALTLRSAAVDYQDPYCSVTETAERVDFAFRLILGHPLRMWRSYKTQQQAEAIRAYFLKHRRDHWGR